MVIQSILERKEFENFEKFTKAVSDFCSTIEDKSYFITLNISYLSEYKCVVAFRSEY